MAKFEQFGERLGEQMNTHHVQAVNQINQSHVAKAAKLEKLL